MGSIIVTLSVQTKSRYVITPFFGIEPAILDTQMGNELEGKSVEDVLIIKTPWLSVARMVHQDRDRYL